MGNTIRRLIIPLLLVLLALTAPTASAVTINALYMKQAGYSVDDIKNITAMFEKENPEIQVNLIFVPYDALHDKIVTAAAAGSSAYDVILLDCIWTPEFAQAGFLLDVTDRVADLNTDDIFEGVLKSVIYEGRYYGMPWVNDAKYLFYNSKMLADGGFTQAPATWDELIEQALAIKSRKMVDYPVVWSWAQAEAVVCDYVALVASFGGEILDENKNPIFHKGAGLEVLQFMVQTLEDGLTNPASGEFLEEDVRRVFSQGEAAFALNWAYMYNLANDPAQSAVAGDCEIAVIPGTDDAVSGSVSGGMGLAVAANCKNPESAWRYIQYMAGKEVQIMYSANALPIYISAYSDPRVSAEQPRLSAVSEVQFKYVVNRPQVTWYPQLSEILQVEIQKALIGCKTPERALEAAAAAAARLAEEGQ